MIKNQLNPLFLIFKKPYFLILLLIICILFSLFFLPNALLKILQTDEMMIKNWSIDHDNLAVFLYMIIFTATIACGIPSATLFTLLGGFLFGAIAILYATISLTLGGTILFFIAKKTMHPYFTSMSKNWIKKFEYGFQKNAFHYLLMMRLVPIFPCWMSNIAAGVLNISFKIFLSATFLGIFPATCIYAMVGRSLDQLFIENGKLNFTLTLSPIIFFSLLALAVCSALPFFIKKIKKE